MKHPGASELALYAGGDLGLLERWRIRRHLSTCTECHAEAQAFRVSTAQLAEVSAELPPGLNWDRLAAEMTANIHLGIEAGECVAYIHHQKPAPRPVWRAAAVMAAMSLVVVSAWYLNPPRRMTTHSLEAPRVEIRSTANGLELNQNGSSLMLLHGNGRGLPSEKPMVTSSPGTLRARYVDDTGQMTINHVYAD